MSLINPDRIAQIRERLDAHPKNYGLLLRVSAEKFRFCCSIDDVRELLDFYETRIGTDAALCAEGRGLDTGVAASE